MHPLDAALAAGDPNLVSGEGWDVAPLVLRSSRSSFARCGGPAIPLHAPAVFAAVAGGLFLDVIVDASGASFPTALAVLVLVFVIVALERMPAH